MLVVCSWRPCNGLREPPVAVAELDRTWSPHVGARAASKSGVKGRGRPGRRPVGGRASVDRQATTIKAGNEEASLILSMVGR